MSVVITRGFAPEEAPRVAALYWEAFGAKLRPILAPHALLYVQDCLSPRSALCARQVEDNRILGVVGFATFEGAFMAGGEAQLRRHYGRFGASWRGALLNALLSPSEGQDFQMDGIFVAPEARGQGVGRALLQAFLAEGRARGYTRARLEVIESNSRAKALYLREGWQLEGQDDIGWLRHIYGFRRTDIMVHPL